MPNIESVEKCCAVETPQQTITRLEFEVKKLTEELCYHRKKQTEAENILRNVMQLMSNPYIRIESITE